MRLSYYLYVVVALLNGLTVQSCKDELTELEKLPPETQEGKYTFGCLVDGKAWVIAYSTAATAFYQEGTLDIAAEWRGRGTRQYISLWVGLGSDNSLSETTYQLLEYPTGPIQSWAHLADDWALKCDWETSLEHQGTITITHLDQVNWIISGTFEFEGYDAQCNSVVKVTHGRFDMHYSP